MKVVNDISELRNETRPIFLAAGFFDGVHRGHAKVIRAAVDDARRHKGQAWVLTMDPHPMKVLNPSLAPPLLTSLPHKLRLIGDLGVDGCAVMPFTRDLAAVEPADFIRMLVASVPATRRLCVGRNWRFGHRGKGTTAMLARLGKELHFSSRAIRPALRTGETISSTRIRSEIQRGNLDEATIMLGRRFSILGTVVPGRKVGRELGYPTANIDPHNEVLPPYGIYAVRCNVQGRPRDGVVSYGIRPTFTRGPAVIELHVLDFSGDLYGRDIEIDFIAHIRDEQRFESPEALRQRIALDVAEARRILASAGAPRRTRRKP